MPIAAISFDVAGTFLHFAEPVAETYARYGERHGLERDANIIRQRMAAAFAANEPLVRHAGESMDVCEKSWWRRFASRSYRVSMDNPAFNRCFDDLYNYFAGIDAWRINPDFAKLLACLRDSGLKLAVVSNFDGRLFGLLDGFGLADYFDKVILPRHAGCQKPDPGMFRYAASILGIQAHELLHLGNHEVEDVSAAESAGAQTMLWHFPIGNGEPWRQSLLLELDETNSPKHLPIPSSPSR